MRSSRRKQIFVMMFLFGAIACLSIGFAAFSTTLNISSSASINPNGDSFKVKFSTNQNSLVVEAVKPSSNINGLTVSNGTINNTTNPIISNLGVTFTSPGQYVEYTVYARNEGEYTAYLNSVNYIGEKTCEAIGDATESLVDSACDSINVVVYVGTNEYRETTEISNHVLAKNTGEQIRIRLEYSSDGTPVDGDCRINFSDIMLVYSTIDDSTFMPDSIGVSNMSGTLYSAMKNDVYFMGADYDVDYSVWDNKSGVFVRGGTENHVNPIYYYRGEVQNNNVVFGGFCWRMVRSTDTGGVKMIYNGEPTAENKCTGDNSTIGRSAFNDDFDSIEDVSYIYSDGTNSTIKQTIDTWYTANMTFYTDMLEDTAWCNDRGVFFTGYYEQWNDEVLIFDPYIRNVEDYQPSLLCPAEYSLTVSASSIANKLTYPVGLLTADEATLSGTGFYSFASEGFLNNFDSWWTMSPYLIQNNTSGMLYVFTDGDLNGDPTSLAFGVRPVVSLKSGTKYVSGNGSAALPYIIE